PPLLLNQGSASPSQVSPHQRLRDGPTRRRSPPRGGERLWCRCFSRGEQGPVGIPLALLAAEQGAEVAHRIRAGLTPAHAAALHPCPHHLLARRLHRT